MIIIERYESKYGGIHDEYIRAGFIPEMSNSDIDELILDMIKAEAFYKKFIQTRSRK